MNGDGVGVLVIQRLISLRRSPLPFFLPKHIWCSTNWRKCFRFEKEIRFGVNLVDWYWKKRAGQTIISPMVCNGIYKCLNINPLIKFWLKNHIIKINHMYVDKHWTIKNLKLSITKWNVSMLHTQNRKIQLLSDAV